MTGTLIRKLLRDIRWALLVVGLLLFLFEVMWVKATQRVTTQFAPILQLIAHSQNKRIEDVEKQFFKGPARVMQTAIGGDQLKFQRAQDVLSIGYVHPLIQVMLCLWAVGRAAGALSGEIERGTMELLLAQPLPRSRIILAHLVIDLATIPILCLCLWGGLWVGKALVGELQPDFEMFKDVPLAPRTVDADILAINVWKLGPPLLNIATFVFAISGMTMWLSAAGRLRWRVIGFAVLILVVEFILNIVGQIWDELSFLRPFSIFYYYQPQAIGLRGSWSVSFDSLGLKFGIPVLLVLVVIGTLGYSMALRTFQRRDLPAPL